MHISLRSHAHLASTSSHYDQAIFPSLCLSMPAGHDFLSRWCDLTVGSGRGQRGKSASTPIPDQRLGRKTFPSFLSRFFGWIRNYTDVRQTNRRKTNLTVCVRKGVPWKGSWRGAGTMTPAWAGPVGGGTQASDFFRGRAGFVFSKPRPLALCIWVNTP